MENKKTKIMIIDDDVSMMDILSIFLSKYGHETFPFTEPISALEELKTNHYDILLINYLMSPINGEKIVELVRQFNPEIYIIMMSVNKDLAPSIEAMNKLDIQAYYEKGSRFDQLILTVQSGIKYIEQINKINDFSNKVEKYILDFAKVLLNAVDAKDKYTGEHSKRVAEYSLRFAQYLKLNNKDTKTLELAALFHDIGKIGVLDNILTKQGRLTNEEFQVIQFHPTIASNILSVSELFTDVYPIVAAHHEKIDGSGYPKGLKEDEIPYLAKILSICDTFDAITSTRSYNKARTIDEAIKELKKVKGRQLDNELTEDFIKLISKSKDNFVI